MKLLIVEDNTLIRKTLERNLKHHYKIDSVENGINAVYQATTSPYDVILLDLNLPDINGESVCEQVRSKGITTPIIVISGREDVKDRIRLLNIGADDYLIKPFNIDELRARINVSIRHSSDNGSTGRIIINELMLDPSERVVTHRQDVIDLRRKEFDLLAYLMYNSGQTLTRTMIMEHIWDSNESLWANVIDVHIKHLRDKIDRPYGTNFIKTMHGLGYKLDAQ